MYCLFTTNGIWIKGILASVNLTSSYPFIDQFGNKWKKCCDYEENKEIELTSKEPLSYITTKEFIK